MSCLVRPGSWQRSADVAVIDHDDRVVALNLENPAAPPVVLEGTAATIWHLLDEAGTEIQLVGAVARAFNVHPATVRADVHAFLLHLSELGLASRSGDRP